MEIGLRNLVLSNNLGLDYGVVTLLLVLSCLLFNYDVEHLNWIELRVYGKALMINHEEHLVSLRISVFTSNCDYMILYWSMPCIRLIGRYDF